MRLRQAIGSGRQFLQVAAQGAGHGREGGCPLCGEGHKAGWLCGRKRLPSIAPERQLRVSHRHAVIVPEPEQHVRGKLPQRGKSRHAGHAVDADKLKPRRTRSRAFRRQRGKHMGEDELVVAVMLEPEHEVLCGKRCVQRVVLPPSTGERVGHPVAVGRCDEGGPLREKGITRQVAHGALAERVGELDKAAAEARDLQPLANVRTAAQMHHIFCIRRGQTARLALAPALLQPVAMGLELRPACKAVFAGDDELGIRKPQRVRRGIGYARMGRQAVKGIGLAAAQGLEQVLGAAALLLEIEQAVKIVVLMGVAVGRHTIPLEGNACVRMSGRKSMRSVW